MCSAVHTWGVPVWIDIWFILRDLDKLIFQATSAPTAAAKTMTTTVHLFFYSTRYSRKWYSCCPRPRMQHGYLPLRVVSRHTDDAFRSLGKHGNAVGCARFSRSIRNPTCCLLHASVTKIYTILRIIYADMRECCHLAKRDINRQASRSGSVDSLHS